MNLIDAVYGGLMQLKVLRPNLFAAGPSPLHLTSWGRCINMLSGGFCGECIDLSTVALSVQQDRGWQADGQTRAAA